MLCVQTFMFWLQPELPMTHKRGSAAPQRAGTMRTGLLAGGVRASHVEVSQRSPSPAENSPHSVRRIHVSFTTNELRFWPL
jgi:hypothetical protein